MKEFITGGTKYKTIALESLPLLLPLLEFSELDDTGGLLDDFVDDPAVVEDIYSRTRLYFLCILFTLFIHIFIYPYS